LAVDSGEDVTVDRDLAERRVDRAVCATQAAALRRLFGETSVTITPLKALSRFIRFALRGLNRMPEIPSQLCS